MSNLVPEKRQDKNGRIVTRHVRSDAGGKAATSFPAPPAIKAKQAPIPPCPDGWIDLYHRTTAEAALEIAETGKMRSKENTDEAYFSNMAESDQSDGYGDAVIWIRVPEDEIEIDNEFPDGEEHYRVPLSAIKKDRILPY